MRRLVVDPVALGAVGLWASGATAYLTLPTPGEALLFWRDDPDLWISIWVVLCLGALLSYWQSGKRIFLGGALGALVVGIAFKEMAYVAPLLALVLLWHQDTQPLAIARRARLGSIALLFGVVVVAFGFRLWALQGYGFRFGSNGSWFYRWLMYVVGGRPAAMLLWGQLAALGVALGVFALWWLWRRQFKAAGALES